MTFKQVEKFFLKRCTGLSKFKTRASKDNIKTVKRQLTEWVEIEV